MTASMLVLAPAAAIMGAVTGDELPEVPAGRRPPIVDVDQAVAKLRAGGLVAIPTETVYGLSADAEQPAAVARVFAVKGRPHDHPLIVHLASAEASEGWIGPLTDERRAWLDQLAEACWPGPLTMLVPKGPRVLDAVTGGRETVGLRVPAHPLATQVLEALAGGLAAPSANRFGRVSPTTAAHVIADLTGWLDPDTDGVIDGGPCPVGVESTIVDLTSTQPQLLRAGAISADEIERIIAAPLGAMAGPSRASGMLAAHYAPRCEVVLAADAGDAATLLHERRRRGQRADVIDRTTDLVVAARHLYADLREADQRRLDAVVVVLPPPAGLGHALRDRLVKAAAGSAR